MNSDLAQPQWRISELLPALALFIVGLTALLYALLYPRGENDQYAVLLQPGANIAQITTMLEQTDAQIVSINERMNVVVVHAERVDAVTALYDAGAWLVFEPSQLSSCIDLSVTGA